MKRIFQMAFIATSGMTFFSYLISFLFMEKVLETELLNQLIFYDRKRKKKNHPAGFAIHYKAGTFFSAIYHSLWKRTSLRPFISTSSMLGCINGCIGISVWHLFFKLHPHPPGIKPVKYYTQLLLAHILFGWLNGLVFRKIYGVTK